MKILKTVLMGLTFVLIFGAASSLQSQTLYFCEDVDDDGYAINSSSTFTIPSGGGWLKFLLRMGYEVGTYKVYYDIYRIESGGKETFETTIDQDVEPEWVWFWKKVTFYDPGNYKVYVYDGNDNFLTSAKVRINLGN
jgi:hypothetical protein